MMAQFTKNVNGVVQLKIHIHMHVGGRPMVKCHPHRYFPLRFG
jgi:hypothetical protein